MKINGSITTFNQPAIGRTGVCCHLYLGGDKLIIRNKN